MVEALRPWLGPEIMRSMGPLGELGGKRLKRASWTQLAGVPFVITTHSLPCSCSDDVVVVVVVSHVPSLRKADGGT